MDHSDDAIDDALSSDDEPDKLDSRRDTRITCYLLPMATSSTTFSGHDYADYLFSCSK
jgi:hypothetical protein